MNTLNIEPNRFLRHWILSAIAVWLVASIASLVTWSPVAILISVLTPYPQLAELVSILSTLAILMLPGLTVGYVLGNMQHQLLNDFFKWDFSPHWVKYSSVGGLLGSLLVTLFTYVVGFDFSQRLHLMIVLPLFILPISILQWRILKDVVQEAWMWILANLVGAIVFSGLFFANNPLPFLTEQVLVTVVTWFIAATSLGVITGVIMLWLYERPLTQWNDEDAELAPVYIEVRNRDDY